MKIEIVSSEQLKIAFDKFENAVHLHYCRWFEPKNLKIIAQELKSKHNGVYIYNAFEDILEFESEADYFAFILKWS